MSSEGRAHDVGAFRRACCLVCERPDAESAATRGFPRGCDDSEGARLGEMSARIQAAWEPPGVRLRMPFRAGLNVAPTEDLAGSTPCVYWQQEQCRDARCRFMHAEHAPPRKPRPTPRPQTNTEMQEWAAQVRQVLNKNGGSVTLGALAGSVRLPLRHRGVGYCEQLEAHGFSEANGVVHVQAAGRSGQRRRREDEAEDEPRAQRRRRENAAKDEPSAQRRRAETDDVLNAADARARAARAERFGMPAEPARFVPSSGGMRMDQRTPEKDGPVRLNLDPNRLYQPRDAVQREYLDHLQSAIPVVDKTTGELESRHPGQPARRGVVVAVGTQGSGKTAFAIQEGLRALASKVVDKIVVSRPTILAKGDGEGLGFLPGSEIDKLRPLAGPVLDHIDEFAGVGTAEQLLKSGQLKLCSFEYMRGTTFKRSWVIADEVQNASLVQLKLLTGRYGEGSKMCILGDPEQCDRCRGHWEHSSLWALTGEIESRKHSDAWACVTFTTCHRHPIARESMDVMAGVEDVLARCGDHEGNTSAGRDRARMFGGAMQAIASQ
jgi:hypothetical protein